MDRKVFQVRFKLFQFRGGSDSQIRGWEKDEQEHGREEGFYMR
jgi:hypothetical protein